MVDNLAYVADSHDGLQIVDVSNPSTPILLGGIDTLGRAESVVVSGDTAYIAANGLWMVDVSDPAAPLAVSVFESVAAQVSVVGDLAYLTGEGLVIVDVTDPANPLEVGRLNDPSNSDGIFLQDELAYVVADGLHVIDVSDPTSPVEIGRLEVDAAMINSVVVSNGIAIVASSDGTVRSVDLSDAASPMFVGKLDLDGEPMDMFWNGGLVYVAVLSDDEKTGGIQIVDVSDWPALTLVSVTDLGDNADTVVVSGNLALVGTARSGMHILDVSDPTAVLPISALTYRGPITGVFSEGDVAYVTAETELLILDVSDPAFPIEIGALNMPRNPVEVLVSKGLAYVGDNKAGMAVIDVSDPKSPVLLLDYGAGENESSRMFASDGLVYIADSRQEVLGIIDLSEPKMPVLIGSLDTPEFVVSDLFISNGLAVMVGSRVSDSGRIQGVLIIADVSDPSTSEIRATLELPTLFPPMFGAAVHVVDDLAYVFAALENSSDDLVSGLRIIDLADPDFPTEIGAFDMPAFIPSGLAVYDGLAFLPGGSIDESQEYASELRIVDVSDPSSAVIVLELSGYAGSAFVTDKLAFVAARKSGLLIIQR